MNTITLKAPAKINTVLDIKGLYPNGYHILDMIMLSIDLCDELSLEKISENEIKLYISGSKIAADSSNLVYKAIDAMKKRFDIKTGVKAVLEKKIPSSAGLGGGSADCAAAIKGMIKLFGIKAESSEIYSLGKALGADVPFCLYQRCARAEGIGEILTPLPDLPPCFILLAKPSDGMPTLKAFKEYDGLENKTHIDTEKAIEYMKAADLKGICGSMGNVLEAVTIKNIPVVGEIKAEMINQGALGALMSGSGSSVFGIYKDEAALKAAYSVIKEKFNLSEIFMTHPLKNIECGSLDI